MAGKLKDQVRVLRRMRDASIAQTLGVTVAAVRRARAELEADELLRGAATAERQSQPEPQPDPEASSPPPAPALAIVRGPGQVASLAQISIAMVAACRLCSVDPEEVFSMGMRRSKARVLAGWALVKAGLMARDVAIRTLKIDKAHPFAPSTLERSGILSDMVDVVVSAILGGDMPPVPPAGGAPVARSGRDVPVPKAPTGAGGPISAQPPSAPRARFERGPTRPTAAPIDLTRRRTPAEAAAPPPPRVRRAHTRRLRPPLGRARIRPVTEAVRRYAGWFTTAGWDAQEVAALFDVHPEDLALALGLQAA